MPRNPDGALILPESVNVNFLKPIISFVEKEDSMYLFSKLGKGNKLPGLIALMDFLCVPVPKIETLEITNAEYFKDGSIFLTSSDTRQSKACIYKDGTTISISEDKEKIIQDYFNALKKNKLIARSVLNLLLQD